MSATSSRFRLAFLTPSSSRGYGDWFARRRWESAFDPVGGVADIASPSSAGEAFAGPESWLVVLDPSSLPLPGAEPPEPVPGRVVAAASGRLPPACAVHTLRELEGTRWEPESGACDGGHTAAILFRPSDFPARSGETVAAYLQRLCAGEPAAVFDLRLAALTLADPFGHDRAEVTRHLPRTTRRLLDVGCGAGEAGRSLKRAIPTLAVTGIESDPGAAGRARKCLDHLLEGDAPAVLSLLIAQGALFDGFLFADVLEHLEDPVAALEKARALAEPGATLVASVPNVGHVSVVRDLLMGRFDPLPAGLPDAGHLRWFTRDFLSQALEEAGWRVERIEPLPGADPPGAAAFIDGLSGWGPLDRDGLLAYQWLGIARAEGGRA